MKIKPLSEKRNTNVKNKKIEFGLDLEKGGYKKSVIASVQFIEPFSQKELKDIELLNRNGKRIIERLVMEQYKKLEIW